VASLKNQRRSHYAVREVDLVFVSLCLYRLMFETLKSICTCYGRVMQFMHVLWKGCAISLMLNVIMIDVECIIFLNDV